MSPKDYVRVYTDLLGSLQNDLSSKIPPIDPTQKSLFLASCSSVQLCQAARDAAVAARDAIPNSDTRSKSAANQALDESEKALAQAVEVGTQCGRPILDEIEPKLDGIDPSLLMKCAVLTHGTPEGMGEFANLSEMNAGLIEELLGDTDLMEEMLKADGANQGRYGQAMQIYKSILASTSHIQDYDILHKLALGTALELCVPKPEFDTPDIFVDPVKRYHHYEDAFLAGELDSSFASRTVWECRMVIDSDAPNEQLGWCREMLRNYRPDEILESDYEWRYCRSVRTEVGYRKPSWTSTPRTYQQLISGGGECGPRAWFGRFSCKAFGIPTWGVRQPGHAAMTHWTPTKWLVCLGADWPFCTWEGRWGPDFHLETLARVDEDEYFQTVWRMEFVADALKEGPLDPSTGIVNPDCFWRSLALAQKWVLSKTGKTYRIVPSPVENKAEKLLCSCNSVDEEEKIQMSDSKIIIPASICSKSDKITWMPSFLGGDQIHIREEATMEYSLSGVPAGTYELTMRVCNVHLKQDPLIFTVNNESDSVGIATIDIPYTIGVWEYTKPIVVELTQGTNTLSFTRQNKDFGGLTIKDITLTCSDVIDGGLVNSDSVRDIFSAVVWNFGQQH